MKYLRHHQQQQKGISSERQDSPATRQSQEPNGTPTWPESARKPGPSVVRRIPDPTTAGDFCRGFRAADVHTLIDILNSVCQRIWARQPAAFFDPARIDMDGTLAPTEVECKQGIDIAYNGVRGYHPLVVSLANTDFSQTKYLDR